MRGDLDVERSLETVFPSGGQRLRKSADAPSLGRLIEARPQLAQGKTQGRSFGRVGDEERLEEKRYGGADEDERRDAMFAESRVDPGSRGLVELDDAPPPIRRDKLRASLRSTKEDPAVERAL
jgi:hypothetical protein